MPGGRSRTSLGPRACTCAVLAERVGQVLTPRPQTDITLTKPDGLWDSVLSPAVVLSNCSASGSSHLRPPPSCRLPSRSEAAGQTQPTAPSTGPWFHSRPVRCLPPPNVHTRSPSGTFHLLPRAPALLLTIPSCPPHYLSLLSSGLALTFFWEADKTPRETTTLVPPPLTSKGFGPFFFSLSLSVLFCFVLFCFVLFCSLLALFYLFQVNSQNSW